MEPHFRVIVNALTHLLRSGCPGLGALAQPLQKPTMESAGGRRKVPAKFGNLMKRTAPENILNPQLDYWKIISHSSNLAVNSS